MSPPVTAEDHVFVDVGCGLGRVVINAASYPFAKVAGVELSSAMADVARRNVARVRRASSQPSVEIINGDARSYAYTPARYVVYLFNPFGAKSLRTVVSTTEDANAPAMSSFS